MSISHPPQTLAPAALDERLRTRGELALIDVREVGAFARKHLLHAVPVPAWRLELLLGALVPRRSTPIVLTDLDGTLVAEAAARLARLGYTDVQALDGGTLGWEAAGLETFTGVNVPSKAFGELVELEAGTPHIDVAELRRLQAEGADLVVLDGRTPEEFANFSLPFAHGVPNGELAYRARELAPDPGTLIVVNCAGRTRSIIGAQTLIDAGLPNRVVSLADGTMAWLLAGHALAEGRRTPLPEPSAGHLAFAREGAQAASRRAGVGRVDAERLAAWAADDARTLYRFDVRDAAEVRAGHLPGWRWAPGGQLVQATDQYVAVRGARIVLADWDGVRAHTTAAWLAQLGHEVHLFVPEAGAALETGDVPGLLLRDPAVPDVPWIPPQQLTEALDAGRAVVFDVDRSLAFGRRHVAGAWFAAPDRLPALAAEHAEGRTVVVTSDDGVLAARVAGELKRRTGADAQALLGGNSAWFAAGLPAGRGRERVLTGDDDAWYGGYAHDDVDVRHRLFREYLAWEVQLAEQVKRPGAHLGAHVSAGRAGRPT